jgi:hypothetical protein
MFVAGFYVAAILVSHPRGHLQIVEAVHRERHGIEAAFGPKRSPWDYSYDEAIGSDPAPEVVAIGFIDRDAQDTREIHEVRLTSTDPEKKWQYVQSEQDTFFYSTRVSATAAITTKDGKAELAKFDISGCQ